MIGGEIEMEVIKVTWQRLVNGDGDLIEKYEKTYLNLEKAIFKLEPVLLNFGVKLCFEKKKIPYENYPNLNSIILIDDQPIEKFVEIKEEEDQVIPEYLIVTAILSRVKERVLNTFY